MPPLPAILDELRVRKVWRDPSWYAALVLTLAGVVLSMISRLHVPAAVETMLTGALPLWLTAHGYIRGKAATALGDVLHALGPALLQLSTLPPAPVLHPPGEAAAAVAYHDPAPSLPGNAPTGASGPSLPVPDAAPNEHVEDYAMDPPRIAAPGTDVAQPSQLFYAYRLNRDGTRTRLEPGGKLIFGPAELQWLRKRAAKLKYKMIVGDATNPVDVTLSWDRWAVANNASIGYAERRPAPYELMVAHEAFDSDCSGTCHGGAKVGGLPDPSGFGFNGQGNTVTVLEHAQRHGLIVPRVKARAGDYAVFAGPVARQHMVRLHQPGTASDPVVFSHGQPSGPAFYPLSIESKAHRGQAIVFVRAW